MMAYTSITRIMAVLMLGTMLSSAAVQAQDAASYQPLPESRLWVEGTSNKSDWTVKAQELDVELDLVPDASSPEVRSARVTVPAAEIVSEKSTIMDRLMHDALKVNEHPEIVFELTGAEPTAVPEDSDATFALNATGRLTIAGETREITLPVEGDLLEDDRVRLTGEHTMLMSDYGIQPPSAMFGALRTGDEVTVHFDLLIDEQ